ncbi:hypothetical protein HBA55_27800 [Pseudomaricurvus alkylphenolicus]|uniref:hypothetical protein n=1 Tax=Pseudomaricurvus alkylphenolicus TaxID=1306991 RepID=UPI001420029C|nr:hypothetical protein [Pseudomaricurvus alkylphenolicus]NIB43445.1 hypothetical protein [Pseudomaricurvus alkylphenolicus]
MLLSSQCCFGITVLPKTPICLVAMLIYGLSTSTMADNSQDKKLHRLSLKMEKAAQKGRWQRVISLGQSAQMTCEALRSKRDPGCISIRVRQAIAYYRSGNAAEHIADIAQTYHLSQSVLGIDHFSTERTRDIYHQMLMDGEQYEAVIPLVIEYIEVERSKNNDQFKILDRLIQLYALYHVTAQYDREESVLNQMLELSEKLLGAEDKYSIRIAIRLAVKYCSEKRYHDFFDFAERRKLDLTCPSSR